MYKTFVSCNSELHNMNWTTRKSMTHDYRLEQTVSHNDDIRLYVRSEGVSDTDTVCYEVYTLETKQLWAKSMLQHVYICASRDYWSALVMRCRHPGQRWMLVWPRNHGGHLCEKRTVTSELRKVLRAHPSTPYSAVTAALPQTRC